MQGPLAGIRAALVVGGLVDVRVDDMRLLATVEDEVRGLRWTAANDEFPVSVFLADSLAQEDGEKISLFEAVVTTGIIPTASGRRTRCPGRSTRVAAPRTPAVRGPPPAPGPGGDHQHG